MLLNDSELSTYLPLRGDRCACRQFCLDNSTTQKQQSRREALLSNLRSRLKSNETSQSDHAESASSNHRPWKSLKSNVNAKKAKRTIEIGWMHTSGRNTRAQVRAKNGGGTRRVIVDRSCTKVDIVSTARRLFFPSDMSTFGNWNEFDVDVTDFKQHSLSPESSIEYLYNSTGLPMLRYYLVTTRRDRQPVHETDSSASAMSPDSEVVGSLDKLY